MSESGVEKLIDFWRRFGSAARYPCVHEDDRGTIMKYCLQGCDLELPSPKQDGRFHLSLNPVPYMGDVRTADIFLLMINPSAGYADYYTDKNPDGGSRVSPSSSSSPGKTYVVEFWATWCGPVRGMHALLDRVAQDLRGSGHVRQRGRRRAGPAKVTSICPGDGRLDGLRNRCG